MPALVNAHDHCRPLSPTSFGAAGKPLETWLLRLAAMPAIDPYLGALAAFGRAARGGAGSVMAHYTRFHGPMPPVEEAKAIARAAADVGVRVTLAVFMRDRNPLVYGDAEACSSRCPSEARGDSRRNSSARPGPHEQVARVEAIAEAIESATFSVQFGPNGPQWCSDELLAAIAEASRRTGRRVHMHLLETRYQRAFADRPYPEGVAQRLKALGLLSPRLTLAHCVHARPEELDAIARPARSSPPIRAPTCICAAASRRSARRSSAAAASRSASTPPPSTRTTTSCARCGSGISCTAAGASRASSSAGWLSAIVGNGRFANGAPGAGALAVGEPADILVLDLDRLDRDAVMPVEPIDLVFARATAAHVDELMSPASKWSATDGSQASISRRRKWSCGANIARIRRRGRRFWRPGMRLSLRSHNIIEAASAAADGSSRVAHDAGLAAHHRSRIIGRKR